MRKNESVDRRWRGVRIPSLYTVILRATEPDEDRTALAEEAWQALKAGKVWREHEAIFSEDADPQIRGYRKVRLSDWFILSDEGEVEGPFPTRKLCLSKLRVNKSSRGGTGVWLTPGFTVFTREHAPDVGLTRQELP